MLLLKKYLIIITILFLAGCNSEPQKVFTNKDINIIPMPANMELREGSFTIDKNTKINAENNDQKIAIGALINKLKTVSGFNLEFVETVPNKNHITLLTDKTLAKEAYLLEITARGILINASDNGGFLYAIESLIQLLPESIESNTLLKNMEWVVPAIIIKDQPRFQWRGLMLDLSRHFFEKEYIMEVIDGLAKHKMNVLHLHLVDDQGWRIEIKKYPKLTDIGAWRVDQEELHWSARKPVAAEEKGTYGGFLSQKDLKEIVAYATAKNVEVIPEIEMPAHVMSALAAYPELMCFDNPKLIGVPSGGVWPITDIYCAGKEHTFEFLENVLLEVMGIFPSQYIHIGGDEATKTNWKGCPYCQKRIKEEGLKDVNELQSYFVKRVEKFINSHGKKLIGWDEILEGGLAPEATVMSWRGVKGGLEAAEQGHDVVMTPDTHCYFDHYQGSQNEEPLAIGGFLPLSKVYQFDPVVDTMTPEEANHVLGGQANLWSEYIPTTSQSQYMIYPRLAALAETVWSPKELRNWDDFSRRIQHFFTRYEYMGVNYAKSAYLVTANTTVDLKERAVELSLQHEFPNADIRYVLGNNILDEKATSYSKPLVVKETTTIKASLFKDNKLVGRVFADTIQFHKAVAHEISYTTPYSDSYKGAGEFTLVNTLRGTKNFHDGQWQAWLNKDMEVVINLDEPIEISKVTVGALENQGPDIYFPVAIEVSISDDGENFKSIGQISRAYKKNGHSLLKDFVIEFPPTNAIYVKVKAVNLNINPRGSGGVWLFIDEILIE